MAASPTMYLTLIPNANASKEFKDASGTFAIALDEPQNWNNVSDRIGLPVAAQGPPNESWMLATQEEVGEDMYRIRIVFANGEELLHAQQIPARFHRFTTNEIGIAIGKMSVHLFSTMKNFCHRLGVVRPWATRLFVDADITSVDVRQNKVWMVSEKCIRVKDLVTMGPLAMREDPFEGGIPMGIVALTNGHEAIVAVFMPETKIMRLFWFKSDPINGTIERNDLAIDACTLESKILLGVGTMAFVGWSEEHGRMVLVVSADDMTTVRTFKFPEESLERFPRESAAFELSGSIHFNGEQTYMIPFIWDKHRVGYFTCSGGYTELRIDAFSTVEGLECVAAVVSPKVLKVQPQRMVLMYNAHVSNSIIARLNQEVESSCYDELAKMRSEMGSTYTVGRIAAYERKLEQLKKEMAEKDAKVEKLEKAIDDHIKTKEEAMKMHKKSSEDIVAFRKRLTDMTDALATAKMKTIEESGGVTQERLDEETKMRKEIEVERDAAIVARMRIEKARNDLEDRFCKLRAKKLQVDTELSNLTLKSKDQSTALARLQKLNDDREVLQAQIKQITERLSASEKKLKDTRESQRATLKDQKSKFATEITELRKLNNDLRSSLGVSNKVAEKLRAEAAEAAEKIAELDEKLQKAINVSKEADLTKEALLAKMKTMEQLQPEAVQLRVDKVTKELTANAEEMKKEADAQKKEADAQKKMVEAQRKKLGELQEKIGRLEKQLEDAKKSEPMKKVVPEFKPAKDIDNELRETIRRLENEVGTAMADKNSLVRQAQSTQYTMDQLVTRNYAMAQEVGFMYQCLQGYLPSGTDLTMAVQQLQSLDVFQRDAAHYRMRASALETELQMLKSPPQPSAPPALPAKE